MLALTSVSLLLMMKTKRGYCNRCLNGAGVMERMELCVCVCCAAAAAEATKEFNLKAINQYYALA